MATEAVIGKIFTFEVLFVDSLNIPMAVNNPAISVFMFDQLGTKIPLVDSALVPVIPAETGRYVFTYQLPFLLVDGDTIYGEMSGIDPGTGVRLIVEQVVLAISVSRGLGGGVGLTARFVKGG